MTQGASGTFSINGTVINTPPTEHQWIGRDIIGYTPDEATPIYPGVRKFEMNWALMSMTDFAQIYNAYNNIRTSGTVIVDLPQYGSASYVFKSYTGCAMEEPVAGKFFEGYVTDVVLIINRIVT